jgi:hypothetical protein
MLIAVICQFYQMLVFRSKTKSFEESAVVGCCRKLSLELVGQSHLQDVEVCPIKLVSSLLIPVNKQIQYD